MLVNFLEVKDTELEVCNVNVNFEEYTYNNRVGFFNWVQSFCQPISFLASTAEVCVLIYSISSDNALESINKNFHLLNKYKKIIIFQEEQDFIC